MGSVKKAFKYLWDLKERRIEAIFRETQHPYAKVQDKVEADRVGRKKLAPFYKKVL